MHTITFFESILSSLDFLTCLARALRFRADSISYINNGIPKKNNRSYRLYEGGIKNKH